MAAIDSMSVAELEAALAQKKSYMSDLLTRRSELERELASIEGELATLGASAPKKRGRPPGAKSAKKTRKKSGRGGQTGPRPKNKLTMKGAVTKALQDAKDGLTLAETAAAVKKLGYRSNSDNFENVVYQCLYNNKKDFPKGKDKKYRVKA